MRKRLICFLICFFVFAIFEGCTTTDTTFETTTNIDTTTETQITTLTTQVVTTTEIVSEIDVQYCKDNPESDFCKGSFIEDLQDQTVEELFWLMAEDQQTQTDFCIAYVSYSDMEFYDECLEGMSFFPDDLDGYSFSDIQSDEIENKNTITIELTKNNHSDTFVFTIVLVYFNDAIYIEGWQLETIQPDEETMFEAMIEAFNASINASSFCSEWFTTSSQDVCLTDHSDKDTDGFTFQILEYNDTTPIHVKLGIVDTIPKQLEISLTFEKIGNTYYIDYEHLTEATDEYLPYLEIFILGLNSVSLTDAEVCGEYLEGGSAYQACVLKRQQVIDGQETISIVSMEWLDEESLTFKVVIQITGEDGVYLEDIEGSFHRDGTDKIWIDIIIPFGLSRLGRTAILNQFVIDTNNFDIDTSTIVSESLDVDTEGMYVPIREYMIVNELSIIDHSIVFGSTTFSFELDNGDIYEYDITWDYVEEQWIMHWERIYYDDQITVLDKMLLLERFILAFNTSAASHEYITELFITDDSTMDCVALRTELWAATEILAIGEVDYLLTPTPVQFEILDSSMTDIVSYMEYDLEYVLIDNQLYLQFTNEYLYFPLLLVEAELIVDDFIVDINDSMMADSTFCTLYGHLFTDCMDFRSRITMDMWTAMIEDFTEEDDGYTLELGLYDMTMRLAELITFDLYIYEDLEENPIIMGSIAEDMLIPPDENYDTIFMAFLEDYFNDLLTDQDIYDTYNDGWEFEGLYHRDLILAENLIYTINDITWHVDMGFTWYEANVTFTYPDSSFFIAIIKYELFPGIEDDYLFRLVYDLEMPSEYTVNLRVGDYVADLTDPGISNADFCSLYASPWDYENCLEFRQQFFDGSYSASLGTVTREEYYADFLVEFTDAGTHSSSLLMEFYPEHDLVGFPWLLVEITHPDTELRDRLSTYIVDGIIYGFNTHGINITTYCDEFCECGTAFDDITSTVHHLTYGEVEWNLDDYFHPELHVIIQFTYYDGVVETHEYYATYVIEDEYYVWTLHFINKVLLE